MAYQFTGPEFPRCVETGKVMYPSKAQAKRALKRVNRMEQRRPHGGIYTCPFCGAFHTTSQRQRGGAPT